MLRSQEGAKSVQTFWITSPNGRVSTLLRRTRSFLSSAYVVCLLASFPFGNALAQDFHRSAASVDTEKYICKSAQSEDPDARLGSVHKEQITDRAPSANGSLATQQGLWLRNRDIACNDKANAANEQRLFSRYQQQRTEALKEETSSDFSTPHTAWCKQVLNAIGPLSNLPPATDPILILASVSSLNVKIGKDVFDSADRSDVLQWGSTKTPSMDLHAVVNELGEVGGIELANASAGSNVYLATATSGVERCLRSQLFLLENNRVTLIGFPAGLVPEACGTHRKLGQIAGFSAIFDADGGDFDPDMTETLRFARGTKGGFGDACKFEAQYSPAFSDSAATGSPQSCTNYRCLELRKFALSLVKEVQSDPIATQERFFNLLKAPNKNVARKVIRNITLAKPPKSSIFLTEALPLVIPYETNGAIRYAVLSHISVGPFTSSDWSVAILKWDGSKTIEEASMAFAMHKGQLVGLSMEPIGTERSPPLN